MIHPTADVQSECIGSDTKIWQYTVVCRGAKIGACCNICSHVFIEAGAVLGSRVTIKNGVQIWSGVEIGDDVFVGPNVTFSNDKYPLSGNRNYEELKTIIEVGASIGAGAVILPGIVIGRGAMVGAGAVVTKNVLPGQTVVGNPARLMESK